MNGRPHIFTSSWPYDIGDSDTWLSRGEEAFVNVTHTRLQQFGLNRFSRIAVPSHQFRGKQKEVRSIARWVLGIHVAFITRGSWWGGGAKVIARIQGFPGPVERVQNAKAVYTLIALLPYTPGDSISRLSEEALSFLRKAG